MKNFHITGYYGWEKDLGLRSSYFPKPQDPRKLEGSENTMLMILVPTLVVSKRFPYQPHAKR